MHPLGARAMWNAYAFAALFLSGAQAEFSMRPLSTVYLPYDISTGQDMFGMGQPAVEQLTFDPVENIIYAVGTEIMHVIDASDPRNLTRLMSASLPDAQATDVKVCGDFLFVTVDNLVNYTEGSLRVYRKYNGSDVSLLYDVYVGALPDNVYVRPGCRSAVIALEAEAYQESGSSTLTNPTGHVVIVEFPNGVVPTFSPFIQVNRLGFGSFNSQIQQLQATGFRIVYQASGDTADADIEPEYVAVDEETNTAYVSLQENNGIAEVDLASQQITAIHGLGYKQYGDLDASDRDGGIGIRFWPIRGLYQPDSIKFHKWQGRRLIFSANEGDSKEYDSINFDDSIRGASFSSSSLGDNIPEFVKTALSNEEELGRLTFSNIDGVYENGTRYALYTYGGRSFSIWDAANNFQQVYDSGSDIEKMTALHCPLLFNNDDGVMDGRSDNKGPETESVEVAEIAGRLYIFAGNERPGTIVVYSIGSDVTRPRFEEIFCDGIPLGTGKSIQQLYTDRELYGVDPEDLEFYPAEQSPTGTPILLVVGAYSGTVTLFEITATSDPGDSGSVDGPQGSTTQGCRDGSSVIGSSIILLAVSVISALWPRLC